MVVDPETRQLLSGVEVVSFDLDDTLWPLHDTLMKAEHAQYAWMQTHASDVTSQLDVKQVLDKRRLWLENNPESRGDVTLSRKRSLAALFDEFGYAPDKQPAMVEGAFDVFYQQRSQVELFHDAQDCLDQLRQFVRLAAITNGNVDLDIVGIRHYFDDVQLGTHASPCKPDPFMFNACSDALGVPTAKILHVGDNIEADVGGGQNAGTLTAWYNPSGDEWPQGLPAPTLTLSSLSQLSDTLAASR